MIFVGRANSPLAPVESITKGCQPTDGGNLIIEEEDYEEFINQEPQAQKYIKRLYGAVEFINNKKRYCLWLKGISPAKLRQMPKVLERVQKVKEMRLNSSATGTRKLSERPHEFRETYNFDSYILIPSTSSENRRYIPIGFMGKDDISTNANLIIPDASLFHFGILTSNVHMAWMRTVAGRLEMRYRYSAKIVYNNFPWPEVTEAQKEKISKTAQAILDARALYPDSSLADLYDELTMPAELRQAHQANDKAVMEVYGMKKIVDGKKTWLTESETVARLFEMYEEITKTK
jgi:methylase